MLFRSKDHSQSKPIVQLDLDGNIIRKFESIKQVQRELGFNTFGIIKCCKKEKKYKIPRFRRNKWRCPEAGLEYLEWEKDLVWDADAGFKPTDKLYGQLTDQALRAREVIEIYDWWVNIYPNRLEPMDASGWSEFCQKRRDKNGGDMLFDTENETAAEKKESASILKKLRKIEASYEKEEQDMLIRLIKIRKGLWS